ncbi:hypothetical protein ACS0TY_009968 [Phlomoides rotata]
MFAGLYTGNMALHLRHLKWLLMILLQCLIPSPAKSRKLVLMGRRLYLFTLRFTSVFSCCCYNRL